MQKLALGPKRMLTGDPIEAIEQARSFLKEGTVHDYTIRYCMVHCGWRRPTQRWADWMTPA